MSCGCKNCGGAVSQNSQLPPGATSILDISSQTVGEEIIVTITLSNGTVQQFSIPLGADGADGAVGPQGETGEDGVSIIKVEADLEGNTLTLTFGLSNGEVIQEQLTLEIPCEDEAYIVGHYGVDIPGETNLAPAMTASGGPEVAARCLIPAGTLVDPGDTIFFDAVVTLVYAEALGTENLGTKIFKDMKLEVNSSSDINSINGIHIPLQAGGVPCIAFPASVIKLSGRMTRRSYVSGDATLTDGVDVVVEAVGLDRSENFPVLQYETGIQGPAAVTGNSHPQIGWKMKDTTLDLSTDNYLKFVLRPESWELEDNTIPVVAPIQVCFTTRYIRNYES